MRNFLLPPVQQYTMFLIMYSMTTVCLNTALLILQNANIIFAGGFKPTTRNEMKFREMLIIP